MQTPDHDDSTINLHGTGYVSPATAAAPEKPAATAGPPLKPPSLPGYELGERLGAGSFGEVWKGVQLHTGQSVAVKIMLPEADVASLQHEVTRLGSVAEHPHVVTLLDANLRHQPPYLVTPLLSGSLEESATRAPSDVKRVVRWLRQMAQALEYCHSHGILHCDLKPANVLLDSQGHVRVVDFGQAAAVGEAGLNYGTFWYMPPEQAHLPLEDGLLPVPAIAWDVYALGATVYQLLTGKLPRQSDTAAQQLSQSDSTVAGLQRYEKLLPALPLVPVRQLNPQVDEDLAALVEHCLEIDPANRYASVDEILQDLARRERRLPLTAHRRTPFYVLSRFVTRNLVPLLAFLVVAGLQMWQVLLHMHDAQRAAMEQLHQHLEQAQTLYHRSERTRYRWLDVLALTQSADPTLARVLHTTNFGTWHDSLLDVISQFDTDEGLLLLLTDPNGNTLVRTDQPSPPHENLAAMAPIATALKGTGDPQHGYWQVGDKLYQITVVPRFRGHYVDGTLLAGQPITNAVLREFTQTTDCQMALANHHQTFASSLGHPVPIPTARETPTPVALDGQAYLSIGMPLPNDVGPDPALVVLDLPVDPSMAPLRRLESSYLAEAAGLLLVGGTIFGYLLWRSEASIVTSRSR